MYDKRYSERQIQNIRRWASFTMFVCMLFLTIGVGKLAYIIGWQNGYTAQPANRNTPAKQQTSYHALQTSSIEIEILAEPQDKTWFEAKRNLLLEYWYWAAIAVAVWAFVNAPFGKKPDKPKYS